MIRARKDESITVTAPSASTVKSSVVVGTPPLKRMSSSERLDGSTPAVNSAAIPPSISSSFAALSASSLQYYNNLVVTAQAGSRVRGTVKKKSSKKKLNDAAIWTQVQMPKRMLWSTMSIFLLFPVLVFVWKELHVQSIDQNELRGKQYDGKAMTSTRIRKKNKHQEFVTWMAKQASPEELAELLIADNDTLSVDSESDSQLDDWNETIHILDEPMADMVPPISALDVRAVGEDLVDRPPPEEGELSKVEEDDDDDDPDEVEA